MFIVNKYLASILFFFVGVGSIQAQEYKNMIDDGTFSIQEIQAAAKAYFDVDRDQKKREYKIWKRWEYDAKRMANHQGLLKSKRESLKELQRYNQQINSSIDSRSRNDCPGNWKTLGPTEVKITSGYNPGVGRVTSIGVDPSNDKHFIVGANTGGVWQTEDDGKTWKPLSDEFVNLDVYALAIAPSNPNVYYWGATDGMIFRSDDKGQTWRQLAHQSGGGNIHRIVVDAMNENEIWTANDYANLHRSTDGGMTWSSSLDETIFDIEVHPTDPNIMYASGFNVYKSTDKGVSFTQLNFDGADNGVKMMAVTKDIPDLLFVLSENQGAFGGIYSSIDQGTNFIKLDQGSKNYLGGNLFGGGESGQAPRDMDIAISQTDADVIFIAGINLWKSTDGGASFTIYSHWYLPNTIHENIAYTHADIDILLIHDNKLFIGSDGGIYRLDDLTIPPDSLAVKDLSPGLSIHQLYKIGVSQTTDELVVGGSQDNGSSAFILGEWRNYYGADGMEGFVTSGDPKTIFGTTQFGGLIKSEDLGNTAESLFANGLDGVLGEGAWVTPFEKSTLNPNTIFVGYDRIYRSDDKGENFYPLSQSFGGSGSVIELKIARGRHDLMYAATDAGTLYKSNQEMQGEWVEAYSAGYYENINSIAIHPQNPDLVALAVSGEKRVLVSSNGGTTWKVWNEGLPNFSAMCVTWQNDDQETLYVGMNYGIYRRSKNDDEWKSFSQGIPNVRVNELEINEITNTIYAATYGRGLWSSPICQTMVANRNIFETIEVTCSPNPLRPNDLLYIQSSTPIKTDIRIFNSAGQIVYRELDVLISPNHKIKWGDFPTGSYFVRLSNPDGIKVIPVISK